MKCPQSSSKYSKGVDLCSCTQVECVDLFGTLYFGRSADSDIYSDNGSTNQITQINMSRVLRSVFSACPSSHSNVH